VNHFTDEEWLDYIKGAPAVRAGSDIRRHLDEGCERCNNLDRFWQAVVDSNRKFRDEVPEDVLRAAQAVYSTWRRQYLLPANARIARLIFDSLLEPSPSGVRAGALPGRRLVHRTGRWLVDLRLESQPGNHILLMGQALHSGKKPSGQKGMGVILMMAAELLRETSANEFGEFQLQFERAKNLRIYIDIPGQRPIAINLPDSDQ
jgi:hypothetical protein